MRLSQTERPRRGGGTRPTRAHERNVVSPLPSQWEGEPRGTLIGQRVKEGGDTQPERVQTSAGSLVTRKLTVTP